MKKMTTTTKTLVKPQTWTERIFGLNNHTSQQRKNKRDNKHDVPGLINDRPHVTIIAGKKGSGKSRLCCDLLLTTWRFCYKEIVFVSPTFRAQHDTLWSRLSPDGITVYETLSDSFVEDLLQRVSTRKDIPTLLILDDVGEEFRKVNARVVNLLVCNSRHYNLSIVCLHQRLTQSPTIVRANADVVIAFAACSYTEIECLWRMVATVPRKQFQAMFASCTQAPHSFMVSIVDKGGRLRFYQSDFKTPVSSTI